MRYLLLQEAAVSLVQVHPVLAPADESRLPQVLRNSESLIKNIFTAMPANAMPNKIMDIMMSLIVMAKSCL